MTIESLLETFETHYTPLTENIDKVLTISKGNSKNIINSPSMVEEDFEAIFEGIVSGVSDGYELYKTKDLTKFTNKLKKNLAILAKGEFFSFSHKM